MIRMDSRSASPRSGQGETPSGPGPACLALLLCCLLVFIPGRGAGQAPEEAGEAPPTGKVEAAFLALYHFDFPAAERLSRDLQQGYPGSYLAHLARVNYFWWDMVTREDGSDRDPRYRETAELAIRLSREALQSGPRDVDLFFFISLHAMQARIDLLRGAWIRALQNLRHCAVQIEASAGREEHFEGFYLTSGMYHYLMGQADRKYPFLRLYALLYPRGDKEKGLRQLEKAFRSGHVIWQTEAAYFLMRIHLDQEDNPGLAEPYARWLTGHYPGNLVYQYYHLRVLEAMGNGPDARAKREELQRLAATHPTIGPEQRGHFLQLFGQ